MMHCGGSGVFSVFTPQTKRNVFTVFIKYVQIKTKYLVLNILDEFVKPAVIIKLYLVLLLFRANTRAIHGSTDSEFAVLVSSFPILNCSPYVPCSL